MSYDLEDAPELRQHTLRRAMLRPDCSLAAAFAEWPDEDLAYAMRPTQ